MPGKRGKPLDADKGNFDSYTKQSNRVDYFDAKDFNIWSYLRVEMFGIGQPGTLEPPNQAHIENFFLVPYNLESLIFLGFFICLDAFLYVITYLPIRVVFSFYLLLLSCYDYICTTYLSPILPFLFPVAKPTSYQNEVRFHRTQTYDIMRGAMFTVGCFALRQINMSQVYHFIRGQSMIKLYVITSMLEIFDKLLSSFGQDAFDALHWHTRYNPRSFKLLRTFFMVTVYVCLHASVYFLHVATLTVVINSVDSALMTVLILNNFSELKTFILKKFDCNNLFQLACSDITERFQMFLFLFLILLVAVAQAGELTWETASSYSRIAALMLLGECFADWFKHAFINKFNLINASVYMDFAYVLRNDILSNQKDEVILDHTYSVTRRLGLSQIPLGCVCIRYVSLALSTPAVHMYMQEASLTTLAAIGSAVFVTLLLLKVAIGVGLVFYSAGAHKRDAAVFLRAPAVVKTTDHGGAVHHNTSHPANAISSSNPVTLSSIASHNVTHNGAPALSNSLHGAAIVRMHSNASTTSTATSISTNICAATSSHQDGCKTPSASSNNATTTTTTTVGIAVVPSPSIDEGDSTKMIPIEAASDTATKTRSRGNSLTGLFPESAVPDSARGECPAGTIPEEISSIDTGTLHKEAPNSPSRGTANTSIPTQTPAHRPPLGRLNLSTLITSPQEHRGGFFDPSSERGGDRSIVTPPMSPHARSVQGYSDFHHLLQSPHSGATSTPIVQLDPATAYSAIAARAGGVHGVGALTDITQTQEVSVDHMSDSDELQSNHSEISRHTVDEAEAQRMQDRLLFMEELSSIERYTVYKGRII